jgi:hypothetical protein
VTGGRTTEKTRQWSESYPFALIRRIQGELKECGVSVGEDDVFALILLGYVDDVTHLIVQHHAILRSVVHNDHIVPPWQEAISFMRKKSFAASSRCVYGV